MRDKLNDIERSRDEKVRDVEEVSQRAQSSDLRRSKERNRIRVVGGSMGIYYMGDLIYMCYKADH